MKQPSSYLRLVLSVAALLLCSLPTRAVTFTNDTAISFNNTNYDGADIVVTNCTLTVDGMHSFASVQVLNGARLTHSFAPSGLLENRRTITNEQHVLSETHAATLANASVVESSIVVQDFYGLVTYTEGVDYVTGTDTNAMTTLLLTTDSAIAEGSMNLVTYEVLYSPVAAGLSLTVTGDVLVAQGGTVNVDGKGYDGALGPGAGRSSGSPLSGSGAGHGGYGGQSVALDGVGMSYDSIQQPVYLGSGGGVGYGGVGGAGGGHVKLVVGGNMRVDGTVSANGASGINQCSGGGSGGSIWLTCSNLSGAGSLSANGGAGEPTQGGGGAGGRISLQFAANVFTGLIPARGGNGYIRGGAGTVYTRAKSQSAGQVLVDNGGRSGVSTLLTTGETFDLIAQGEAIIVLPGSQTFGNLLVASNAWISLSNQTSTVTVTGNATIQAGGGIITDGTGYAGGEGTGAGRYDPYAHTGGGGGYGGFGAAGGGSAAYGGISYGSVTSPVDRGSGGACYPSYGLGGAGGGAIRLNVTGMLVLDGRISADGGVGIGEGSGGGSGGSVWLTVGTLTGAGTLSANGGMGNGFGLTGGGSGGGGRIAIQYGLNLFFGVISARGGSGSAWGGAGTVYTKASSQSSGLVLADNGGQSGTNTSWSSTDTIDLIVKGGAVVSPPTSQTIGTLLVASNGWLSVSNQILTVTNNAAIQAGGGIIADTKGNAPGLGTGAGRFINNSLGYIGGGGGYGGCGAAGGAPPAYSAYGGSPYGSLTAPVDLGSGGGSYSTYMTGGSGGGLVRLNVTGVLQVDGTISAAGGAATTPSGGGGSGGGINLTVGTLAGSGVISANGGAGNGLGGGGGGGRVAIVYGGNDFSGIVSAYGGGGYAWGGAGTIYTKASNQSTGLVLVDNGGHAGTNTSLGSITTGTVNLTLKNGAVFSPTGSQSIGTLLVASNAWVVMASGQAGYPALTITSNATIQAGGGIIADGLGNPAGSGTGAGKYVSTSTGYIGGGGGYGGYGAAGGAPSGYLALGGIVYGSVTAPADMGSGGGGYGGTSGSAFAGGAGGGVIRLTVTGILQVDGRVSARGLAGTGPSAGGGSGGSIYITVGTLAGSGLISANGGAGNSLGGGGGGGRIAVVYTAANTFSGLMSAYGGGGYAWGGAGTIYTKAGNQSTGLVLVDNGGQTGTNTSWAPSGTVDLTVKGGGILSLLTSQTIGNLLVASNGWISVSNQLPTFTVTGNATIQAGGGIVADGAGYAAGAGLGAGGYTQTSSGPIGGGGGYGGYGATGATNSYATGGGIYGSLTEPSNMGSGGGGYSPALGGAGGGLMRLAVTGALEVDGKITANGLAGTAPSAGGGSGGCILLSVGTLSGSGVIAANGGAGISLGGGGGGGRIAINYTTSTFSGLISAYGGGGYAGGGAGTIYTKGKSSYWGQVVADNGGLAGTNTSWLQTGTFDLTILGGAVVSPLNSQTLANLLVASNGWINVSTQTLTITSNATVLAGGGILADGAGYVAGTGSGAGRYGSTSIGPVGAGGGYGGYGANGATNAAIGGSPYGSLTMPLDPGSGGGGASPFLGGAGGGVVHLIVTGALRVDGKISANGVAGTLPSAGGGSGGGICLAAGTLAGSGLISANGGAGNALGGGGGGGRIAIVYTANTFAGLMSAYGGGGYARGGAGTIYSKANSQNTGLVVVDNGGQAGTNTSWTSAGTVDVTVKGGAALSLLTSQGIGNLLVASNGWVTLANQVLLLTVNGNATIQPGGGILADGTGYASGAGPGAGKYGSSSPSLVAGGGGYGGYGAMGGTNSYATGGGIYGSLMTPSDMGSGGGGYSPALGGAGGGVIQIKVTGALEVDGKITANGLAGTSPSAGGGSGGSISLTVGTLAGAGIISANGGPGNDLGGGGGGGRIAINYTTSAFSGLVSAYGGGGYAWGGAGTIYTKAYRSSTGQVVADNGGRSGAYTSWLPMGSPTQPGIVDLAVMGGAVVSPPSSQSLASLLVASNGWISVSTQTLTVTSNATVQAGGGILADSTGYPAGQGTGAGKSVSTRSGYVGSGAGYGGYGAASGGTPGAAGGGAYGSVTAPVDLGSGGGIYQYSAPGSAGGGAIHIGVTGTLLVNGRISANGGAVISQGGGGGSGGGVWLTAGTLAGAGTISANGGAGNELGGGGGGGRISIQYGVYAFDGTISAYGGGGYAWGGAGTIYTKANSQNMGQLLVDNGGQPGTNTPIAYLSPFDLTIRGGAVAYPSSSYLLLSNLLINTGGSFTCLSNQTTLDVAVLRNATIDAGGLISVDGQGFGAGTGPGAGLTTNLVGSGAGYGARGGASSLSPGGATYGSAQQPVDLGSGGGRGWQGTTEGAQGGGAIRFTVGKTLTVNGRLSAGGNSASQDDGGGGSGGSIWLMASALGGTGAIAADGGAGELYDGGAGGGGRIAIYTPINAFDGVVSAAGGYGLSPGQTGSIFCASTPAPPQVVSSTPTGSLNSAVSSVTLVFSTVVNSTSVSPATVALTAPGGVTVSNMVVSAVSPYRFQVTFPQQIAPGDYVITVGPQVLDLFGQPMSQAYTGAFSIVWSPVQGAVTDTNGLPIPGVVLQPDSGIPSATTDTNGIYLLSLPPVGTIVVTPSATNLLFVPSSRTYANLTGAASNHNYLAVNTVAFALSTRVETNTYVLSWYGVSGVYYQPLYSTNLVDWLPYDGAQWGTNGPLQLLLPIDMDPVKFFRVDASY
jgi:hypothetical protein